jgi:hypothetical protein
MSGLNIWASFACFSVQKKVEQDLVFVSVHTTHHDNVTRTDEKRTILEIISGAGKPLIISKMD